MGTNPNRAIRTAIIGVGNCASSLVQGVEYYKDAEPGTKVPGLMHVQFGDYHVSDVQFVANRQLVRQSQTTQGRLRTTATGSGSSFRWSTSNSRSCCSRCSRCSCNCRGAWSKPRARNS